MLNNIIVKYIIEVIWPYIVTQIHLINPLIWILLFAVSIIYDVAYTKSIIFISRLNAVAAANLSVLLYLMMSYGTINYIENPFNLVPIAVGAWWGTFGVLKYEKYIKNKNRREKDRLKRENKNI